ncbi:AAA family ATPase [Streptomyces sp. ISL-12]|uniref:AAA family ATPase n=1 Tax=Streptomyces sp. ISL-12 TaxID=2819177 RepID=UPI001BE7AE71|nr:AAA family ATPase [Streptomyces sp. ISL-12]MBT2416000.1 AAA family ATPase [Streptomyces sp. ISL-12]
MIRPLCERDDAHALIAAATERARAGTGRLVLLRGATGTGRTAVLEAAAEHAEARGLKVLRVHCSPQDSDVPFSAVRECLSHVPDFAEPDPGRDDRETAVRLWRCLCAYAAESPVMVTVDDVHLADSASRRWLVEAARRVGRLPILLVATERSQYDVEPGPPGLTHALPPSLVSVHTLAPLGDIAAAALPRAAFPAAGPDWTAECVRAGAGSPLLLRALLEDLGGTGSGDGGTAYGDRGTAYGELPSAGPRGEAYGESPSGDVRGTVAGESPSAGVRGTVAGESPSAGVRGTVAGGLPPAGPRGTAAGEVPSAGPQGTAYGELPPAGPRGTAAGEVPSAGPQGTAYGELPSAGVRGTVAGESPSAGVRGTAAGGLPPAGPHGTAAAEAPSVAARRATAGETSPVGLGAVPSRQLPQPVPDSCAALYPGAYPAAVSWWLENAGTATAEVARALATLEQAWTTETTEDPAGLLAEATGTDPARVAGWLTAMTRLGLLRPDLAGRPRYAHPLLRDAVLTGWPTARRERAHRVAAEAMLRRGGRVEAVARHLVRTPAVGLPWALRVLRDAVTAAVDESRPEDAVAYLRRALEEPVADDLRQRMLTELGSLEYAAADAPTAIARLGEALHLPAAPRDRARTAIALGTALAGRGEVGTALGVLRRTEGHLTGHPGLARTVRTASVLLSDHDDARRQDAYRRLSESAARSPETAGTAGRALLVRYDATAGRISADEAMKRIRELLAEPGDPLSEPFLLGTAATVAQWADELDEAERLVERGLAGQRLSLLHPMRHALLAARAGIAAARGDHAALLAHLTDDTARRAPWARGTPFDTDAHALLALVHTGRLEEARRFADGFDLRQDLGSWELNRFLYARGALRAATGDHAGALHDFLECGRRQSGREVLSPVVTPWRTAVAECRLALGRTREALDLATEELRLARVWNTPRTVGRALRVLGTATGGRHGLELTEEAVRVLRDAPADTGMELAEALLARGRQLIDAGERVRARALLREAAERAEDKGALRLRALAWAALRDGGARRTGTDRTGSDALTGSERRIAELAADGRTNAEIADLLHLARRTVETHLTSAYRKLRIRRRVELRAVLEPQGQGQGRRD